MRFFQKIDKKALKLSAYIVLTVGIAYALILLIGQYKVIGTGLYGAIQWVGTILKPMMIGGVIAYILYPLCRLIEKKVFLDTVGIKDEKKAHLFSAVITIIIFFLILLIAVSAVVFAITKQMQGINGNSINTLVNSIINQAEAFESSFKSWLGNLNIEEGYLLKIEKTLVGKVMEILHSTKGLPSLFTGIAAGASTMLFSILFAAYFLLDGPNLKNYWKGIIRVFWSQRANDSISYICKDIDEVFSGYFRGEMTDALVMAVIISMAFAIIKMPYGVMIGVVVGIANLIPYMGPVVGYGLTVIAGLVTGQIETMIVALIIIAVIQVLDGAVINPKLLSNSVEIHPMLVIVALLAGNKVGGFIGMIAAVPVAALVKVWFERFVETKRKERCGRGQLDKDDRIQKKC
ncbi:PF01594 domain protein [Eubacterium nodatum ATCC 33099]|nr:PF01594 domain protein [Eubacterium nodatum ATCC 33099]